jgi:hypothetical protein
LVCGQGREPPTHDPPPEAENLPILAPVVAPIPAQPLCETTPDLSPLSNPYAYRIEWFDTLDNSLGFAPPPPSPPHRPPPPPSPSRHPPTTFVPTFSPSSSYDSPLSPHLRPVCDRCDDRAMIMDSLSDLKRDLGESSQLCLICRIRMQNVGACGHFDVLPSGPPTSYSGPRQGKITGESGLHRAKAWTRFLNYSMFQVSVFFRFPTTMEGWPAFFFMFKSSNQHFALRGIEVSFCMAQYYFLDKWQRWFPRRAPLPCMIRIYRQL